MDERKVLACAQAAHEVNRAYCVAIGDMSQPVWDLAPHWQRVSAIAGVDGVLKGNGPEASHASWLKQKLEDGWTYGEMKDPEAKTHPCMVAYDLLPESQKAKDLLFVTTVRQMATALGMELPQ